MSINIDTAKINNFTVYNNTTIASKVCSTCNQNKPLTEYYKDKSKSDGLRYSCKSCRNQQTQTYKENHKQIVLTPDYQKQCSNCNQLLSKDKFNKDLSSTDTLKSTCKQCINQNKNKIIIPSDYKKQCSKCKLLLSKENFNIDNVRKDNLRVECKLCQSIVAKHYMENNRQINANR